MNHGRGYGDAETRILHERNDAWRKACDPVLAALLNEDDSLAYEDLIPVDATVEVPRVLWESLVRAVRVGDNIREARYFLNTKTIRYRWEEWPVEWVFPGAPEEES